MDYGVSVVAKYIVQYIIEGEREIEADTREAAQEMFELISQCDLGTDGLLAADDPRTPEEIKEGIFGDEPVYGDGS